jgi:hypothetical protein
MARKALWLVILLVALLALSVSAVFAANVTRPAQAAVTPKTELSTLGKNSGSYKSITTTKSHGRGDCPYDGDSAVAY